MLKHLLLSAAVATLTAASSMAASFTIDVTEFEMKANKELDVKLTTTFDGTSNTISRGEIYCLPGKLDNVTLADLSDEYFVNQRNAPSTNAGLSSTMGFSFTPYAVSDDFWYTLVSVVVTKNGSETIGNWQSIKHGYEVTDHVTNWGIPWSHHVNAQKSSTYNWCEAKVTASKEKYANGVNTVVEEPVDITHRTTLLLTGFGFAPVDPNYRPEQVADDRFKQMIYVQGEIVPADDNHHFTAADKYEVWIEACNCRQNPSSIDLSMKEKHEKGQFDWFFKHINVPEYYTDFNAGASGKSIASEANKGNKFNVLFTGLYPWQYNSAYSVFVKTIHADPNIPPTYTAFAVPSDKIVTGITDITADGAVVEGEGTPMYFDMQGREHKGELTPGMYIKQQGSKTSKVVIK